MGPIYIEISKHIRDKSRIFQTETYPKVEYQAAVRSGPEYESTLYANLIEIAQS